MDEVRVGIKTLNRQIDMDLVVRLGNHYGIIEAKTGDNGRSIKGIQQLSTSVSLLGTYSRAFHIITVPPHPEQKALRAALGFKAISLQSYDAAKQEISAQNEAELLTEIKNAFLEPPGAFYAYS